MPDSRQWRCRANPGRFYSSHSRGNSMILDDIVAYKKEELAAQKQLVSLSQLQAMPLFVSMPPSFVREVRERKGRSIIAEVKKASPSKGVIRADFEPLT